jgi:hypothetical protein
MIVFKIDISLIIRKNFICKVMIMMRLLMEFGFDMLENFAMEFGWIRRFPSRSVL